MGGAKKIRIAAFHGEHADTAGVVIQRPGVEPAHSRLGEVFLKFGPSFLALAVNDLVMLADVDNFLGKGRPLEDFVEWSDVWRVGIDLSEAGDGAEFEAAALLQSNGGTLVRDHRLRGVDDGLEHALQILHADVPTLVEGGLAGYVVPSRLYGILAAGRPALVSADGESETAQLVRDVGCGLVVPPGEPDLVAAAIRALAAGEHDLAEMGRRGRNYVEREAGRDTAFARYRALLAELR